MCTMDLIGAEGTCSHDLRIRIVILPPMTVAAYHFIGENPEESVGDVVDKFVRDFKLYEKNRTRVYLVLIIRILRRINLAVMKIG